VDITGYLRIASILASNDHIDHQRVSYIKKHGPGEYEVKSEKNPDWSGGTYKTKAEAEKRLQQVEMFKSLTKRGIKGKPKKK